MLGKISILIIKLIKKRLFFRGFFLIFCCIIICVFDLFFASQIILFGKKQRNKLFFSNGRAKYSNGKREKIKDLRDN